MAEFSDESTLQVSQTNRTILYIFLYYSMQDTSIRLHYITDDIINLYYIILVN